MSFTLLIWSIIPEETHFYLIPDDKMPPHYHDYLAQAHGKFLNCEDELNDGLRFLNTALGKEHAEPGFKEYLGVLREFKQDPTKPIIAKTIKAVYHSGYCL